jgi:hypothetical protein
VSFKERNKERRKGKERKKASKQESSGYRKCGISTERLRTTILGGSAWSALCPGHFTQEKKFLVSN